MVRQATRSVDTVYFLARNDRITLTALALLRNARRRGVPRVRLIVDANSMHIQQRSDVRRGRCREGGRAEGFDRAAHGKRVARR